MLVRPPSTLVASLALTCAAAASPSEDATALEQRLAKLEHDVARLVQPDLARLDRRRQVELEALVQSALAQAESDTLADDLTAGYDDGFYVQSADGAFTLAVGGQLQTRYVYNRRRGQSQGNETRGGFEVRRAKLSLDGQIADLGIDWSIGFAIRHARGYARLQSFEIRKEIADNVYLSLARGRAPLLKEETVSSKRQLAAERSLVSKQFNQPYRVGAFAQVRWDDVRLKVGVVDPTEHRLDTNSFTGAARLQWLIDGRFSALSDYSSDPDDDRTIAWGAGARFTRIDENRLSRDTDILRWTTDLTIEEAGSNFMGAFVLDHESPARGAERDTIGVVLQAGTFITPDWEAFARYEWGDADGAAPELSVVTFGFTRFWGGHEHKFTIDIGYGFNEVAAFWSNEGAGWLPDEPGTDGQAVARAQFQLLW